MVFEIQGKVALITGGASGIGLNYAKELLRNGLRGVTLADLNPKLEQSALEQIRQEFGPNKAIFVKTDVTSMEEFEGAFKKTVEKFDQVDILINNAGVLNDAIWEKQISINVNGTIHGILLGLEMYLPKYHKGPDALILNISSIVGLAGAGQVPVYSGTKHAVLGLTKSWGNPRFYQRTTVRVVAVCPGVTMTPLITEMSGKNFGAEYEKFVSDTEMWPTQNPEDVAKGVMHVIKYAPNGSTWVLEGGQTAYEYIFPERETMRHNVITHFE